MDDGLGFAIGSILGGVLFQAFGGRTSFQIYAAFALLTCIAHYFLRPTETHEIRTLPIKPKNVASDKVEENDVKDKEIEEKETFEIVTK